MRDQSNDHKTIVIDPVHKKKKTVCKRQAIKFDFFLNEQKYQFTDDSASLLLKFWILISNGNIWISVLSNYTVNASEWNIPFLQSTLRERSRILKICDTKQIIMITKNITGN